MRKLFGPLALVLALIGASAGAKQPKVGDLAPDFELTLVDGRKVALSELRGNVVVLNFWATWCVPCRAELPILDRYYDIQAKAGLRVFAVTTEDSVPLNQLRKLFSVMRIPPVRKLKGPYGDITALPTNYVIDRAGRVRYAKAGAFDLDMLNQVLVPLLNEPAPPA